MKTKTSSSEEMLKVRAVAAPRVVNTPLKRAVWNPFAPPLLVPVPKGVNIEPSEYGTDVTTEPSSAMWVPDGVHHWISLLALSSVTGSPDTHTGRPFGPSVPPTS